MKTQHNLPLKPYKKFFGREEALRKIEQTLLEGGTFIASIDGVGGIGKTALAYYYCEKLLSESKFNCLVWFTAKETVFDPFSREQMIKQIQARTSFKWIEELIDSILSVIGFEDLINRLLEKKKAFVEDEVLKKEKIFLVLDNLESINDDQFFDYIMTDFNKFAYENKHLKVLTTSRKRKKIADFPIEIEGLKIEDALKMLKFLASEYNIKAILNATDHDNIKLLEKVGCIPLGIEFIIGQMSLGKTIGQIYQELEGYPSLDKVSNDAEKKKRLSDIILFSFKNMYETLKDEQKDVFQTITALVRNKLNSDPPISIELLMSITNYTKSELETILETLIDNNLIRLLENNEYSVTQMSVNFVRQYFEDFGRIEDEIIEKKNRLIKSGYSSIDKVDFFINSIRQLIDNNRFEEAESKLLEALDVMRDYRIHFELARVQRTLNKFIRAEDNFKLATELNPKDKRIWYEWINMEENRNRYNIALQLIEKALEKTNNDISIFIQRINILKYRKKFEEIRNEVDKYLKLYEKEERHDDSIRLLRNWKNIEYRRVKDENAEPNHYFAAVDKLVEKENDLETKIQLLNEALKVAKSKHAKDEESKFYKQIKVLENKIIRDMGLRIKQLNKLFNNKNYE